MKRENIAGIIAQTLFWGSIALTSCSSHLNKEYGQLIEQANYHQSIAQTPYKVNGRSFMDGADKYHVDKAQELFTQAEDLKNSYSLLIRD